MEPRRNKFFFKVEETPSNLLQTSNPHAQIPNPQSPIPNPRYKIIILNKIINKIKEI
jgi:hypothetical protein